jgi:hypothetical protein
MYGRSLENKVLEGEKRSIFFKSVTRSSALERSVPHYYSVPRNESLLLLILLWLHGPFSLTLATLLIAVHSFLS